MAGSGSTRPHRNCRRHDGPYTLLEQVCAAQGGPANEACDSLSTLLSFLGSELRAEDYVEKFTTCAAIFVARLPYVCISSASPCSPGCLPHRRKLAILSDTRDSSAAAPHTAGADLLVHEVRPNGSRWHSSESRLHLRLISLHLNCSSSAYRLQLLLQATNACTDEDRRRGLTEREVRRTTVEQGSW